MIYEECCTIGLADGNFIKLSLQVGACASVITVYVVSDVCISLCCECICVYLRVR